MNASQPKFSHLSFAKTFVLPGLLVFLVPVFALLFFLHAQSRFDSQARESVMKQIRADSSFGPDERARMIAFYNEHPFSELIQKSDEFAASLSSTGRFYFATFRWMIRLSILSIVAGVAVFVVAGLCVLLSMRSQRVQYWSLSAGWQVLRIYGALQTIIQGILLVALSYWVTALWLEVYSVKLIFAIAILALFAVCAVIAAIFRRIDTTRTVEGRVIDSTAALPLWNELKAISNKVGTAPPDQIIVGIDDNFFVTEHPIVVDGKTLRGRTLYVSLSLLKQMNGAEADSVLAHEMAHFSGEDTVYSKKISPLLVRYGAYLAALYGAGITKPIYYFMHCFRALFELSLSKLSRQREFRADQIAASITSPRDFSAAMLRIAAYSKFRGQIQQTLFEQERALAAANISQQIGEGFHQFAPRFACDENTAELQTSHPFDTHPPVVQRLEAVGERLTPELARELLAQPGDGRWFKLIENADELEREQWARFEDGFRRYHEETLAYRFFPETDEERAIVEKAFPAISIEGKKGTVEFDYDRVMFSGWAHAIRYAGIEKCIIDNNKGTLQIQIVGVGKQKLPLSTFGKRKDEVLQTFNRYYNRYLHAKAYQEQKKAKDKAAQVGAQS